MERNNENNNNLDFNSLFSALNILTTSAANGTNSGQTNPFIELMNVISGASDIADQYNASNVQSNQAKANNAGGSSSSSNSQPSVANPISNVLQQFSFSMLGMNVVVANAVRSVLLCNKINVDNFIAFTNNNNTNVEDTFSNIVKFRKAVNHNNVKDMDAVVSKSKGTFKIVGSNPAFENFIKLSFMAGNNYHLAIVEKLNQMDKSDSIEHTENVHDFFSNLANIETPPTFNDQLTPAVVKFYNALFKIEFLLFCRKNKLFPEIVQTKEIAEMNFDDFYNAVKFYEEVSEAEVSEAKVNFDLVDVDTSVNTSLNVISNPTKQLRSFN
jgi:hypothetical protein